MIAPSDRRCKRPLTKQPELRRGNSQLLTQREHALTVTGTLAEIIIPPYFRPATALLDCEKKILRWPGPFGPGFLSPQPPGVVGIGPVRRVVYPHTGPTKVGPFLFLLGCHSCSGRALARTRNFVSTTSGFRVQPTLVKTRVLRCAIAHQGMATVVEFSEATYTPRPASDRGFRDCRPGDRPPRHRCPRGKCFPAERSSCRDCRPSRRP